MLVAVLLLAQAAVASHLDLDDSHAAGDSCALCAGSSVLGAANVASVVSFDVIVARAPAPAEEPVLRVLHRRSHFHARGPPAAS
jgi:hypothetical protein